MVKIPYDRAAAVAYAERWALGRNPAYFDFQGIGGDCTNFVSQCVYAGCGVMNYTPEVGWFYISPDDRTASWTGVEYFTAFMTDNQGPGPFGVLTGRGAMQPGDVIQQRRSGEDFIHTLLVLGASGREIYVAAHSNDALWRPLSSYPPAELRYLHIEAARREQAPLSNEGRRA